MSGCQTEYKFINLIGKYSQASITKKEYMFLFNFVKLNNINSVLEFGPGLSTCAFMENDCEIYSYENQEKWFLINKELFNNFKNVNINLFEYKENMQINELRNKFFDLAFIDSPVGTSSMSRLYTCLFASKKSHLFLLHDSNRIPEKKTLEYFRETGEWEYFIVPTERGIGVCYKKQLKPKIQ